jgi:hypothetical protein
VKVNADSDFGESVRVKVNLDKGDKLLVECICKSPSSDDDNHEALNKLVRTVGNIDAHYGRF